MILPVFYIPTSLIIHYLPEGIEKRLTLMLGALFCAISCFFVGPSAFLPIPDTLLMMGVGQALLGVFTVPLLIPVLPEMVNSVINKYPG